MFLIEVKKTFNYFAIAFLILISAISTYLAIKTSREIKFTGYSAPCPNIGQSLNVEKSLEADEYISNHDMAFHLRPENRSKYYCLTSYIDQFNDLQLLNKLKSSVCQENKTISSRKDPKCKIKFEQRISELSEFHDPQLADITKNFFILLKWMFIVSPFVFASGYTYDIIHCRKILSGAERIKQKLFPVKLLTQLIFGLVFFILPIIVYISTLWIYGHIGLNNIDNPASHINILTASYKASLIDYILMFVLVALIDFLSFIFFQLALSQCFSQAASSASISLFYALSIIFLPQYFRLIGSLPKFLLGLRQLMMFLPGGVLSYGLDIDKSILGIRIFGTGHMNPLIFHGIASLIWICIGLSLSYFRSRACFKH